MVQAIGCLSNRNDQLKDGHAQRRHSAGHILLMPHAEVDVQTVIGGLQGPQWDTAR